MNHPTQHDSLDESATQDREVLPGATRQEIAEIDMTDLFDYNTPEEVPAWKWVEDHASYAHVRNGQDGIWEFVLNLGMPLEDIPASLLAPITRAREQGCAYMLIHQGT